jgi:hypothetical protein
MDEMRVLDQQPVDLALHFFLVSPAADGDHVGEVAHDGDVHADLRRHPRPDEARLVFRADLKFPQISLSIGAVETEADNDDDKSHES